MGKRLSMYVHPWDLFDEGPGSVLENLREIGVSTISVATSYHAGRYILPHNPVRKVFVAEEGVVYFDFKHEYFVGSVIKPCKTRKFGDRDVLKEVCEYSKSYGVDVSSWTVLLHNRRFALKYPELALVDPFGCRDENFLCPNRPESRAYVLALSENIVGSYDVGSIQLESAAYPAGIAHGNHHENFGVRIDPTVSYLFSMCYCDHCRRKALEHNLDLDEKLPAIRKILAEKINEDSDRPADLAEEGVLLDLQRYGLEKIHDFKAACTEEVYSLVSDGVKEVDPNVSVEAIVDSATHFNQGFSFEHVPPGLDGVDLVAYYPETSEVVRRVVGALSKVKGETRIYPCIRITYPVVRDNAQLAEVVGALSRLDISGINFYNYGWATTSRLKALGDMLRPTL